MKKERAQLDEQASALASEVKRLGAGEHIVCRTSASNIADARSLADTELKEVTVQPLNEEARERIDALSLSVRLTQPPLHP